MIRRSTVVVLLGLLAPALFAADWPQWQGPERDNVSPEKGLLKQWPKSGPALVWTCKDVGIGFSSPAVVGARLYTMGARGADAYLIALDIKNGREVWKLKVGPAFTFKGNQWGDGPRATPTVTADAIYALGGDGTLVSATLDGKERWRVHMINDLGGQINEGVVGPPNIGCGYSWSPLVDGNKVICFPGGSQGAVAALDVKNGRVLWRSKELKVRASYSSPIVAEVEGVRQYIVLFSEGLAGVDAQNGAVLWRYKKSPGYQGESVFRTPLYHAGHVYVSVGSAGCDMVKLTKDGNRFTAKKVYANKIMKNNVGGYVLVGNHVYGYSDRRGWLCQDFTTGSEKWSERQALKAGSVTCADGQLYCRGEDDGAVVLVEVSTEAWKEKGRFEPEKSKKQALRSRHWTPPVIANGCLYVRDQELLFCYKIKQ